MILDSSNEFYGTPVEPKTFFRFEMSSTQEYIDLLRKEEYVFQGNSQKKLVIKKDIYGEVYYPIDITGIGNIYKVITITAKDVGVKLKINYINENDTPVSIITPYFSEFNYLSFLPSKSKITSIEATTDSVDNTIIAIFIFSI